MPPPLTPSATTAATSPTSKEQQHTNPRYPDISQYPISPDPETLERRYAAATTLESFEMQVLHSSIFDESMARTRLRMMRIVAGLPTDPTQPPASWSASADRTRAIGESEDPVVNHASAAYNNNNSSSSKVGDDETEAGPSRSGPGRGIGTARSSTGLRRSAGSGVGRGTSLDHQMLDDGEEE